MNKPSFVIVSSGRNKMSASFNQYADRVVECVIHTRVSAEVTNGVRILKDKFKGKAHLHPDDSFDSGIGRKIAFERSSRKLDRYIKYIRRIEEKAEREFIKVSTIRKEFEAIKEQLNQRFNEATDNEQVGCYIRTAAEEE